MTSQDSKVSRYIKCRFCDWKVSEFTTTSRGKRVHNYYLLQEHCMMCHEKEMRKFGLLQYSKEIDRSNFE